MEDIEKKYLLLSLSKLSEWLDRSPADLLAYYTSHPSSYAFEKENGLCYLIFAIPRCNHELIILLVYDQEEIIADTSAYHAGMEAFLYDRKVYDCLTQKNDWLYLEYYTLCSYFLDVPYPPIDAVRVSVDGEAFLINNSYVTIAYRRQGIFTRMLSMLKSFVLRSREGQTDLYGAVSLDPDVPLYGPDADDKPYYYNYEKDEPVRMVNRSILEKEGFEVLRLEETQPDPDDDGTKLWFGLLHEREVILDSPQINPIN